MAATPLIITLLMLIAIFHLAAWPLVQNSQAIKNSLGFYGKATFNELFSLLIVMLTYPVNLSEANPKGGAIQTPILMIHGFMHNSSAWTYQKKALEKEVGPIYVLNLGSKLRSIETYEEEVAEMADKIRQETGCSNLFLIGHSMGGLLALKLSRNYAKINGLITLGTPFRGTKMASLGVGKAAREMKQDSPFIQSLQKDLEAMKIPSLHISSDCDVIVPSTSALPKRQQDGDDLALVDGGHMALLYSKTVRDEILKFYRHHVKEVKQEHSVGSP